MCHEIENVEPHTFGEWTVVKDAPCTEEGSEKRVCAFCGDTETETLPLLEHRFENGN